MDNTEFTGTDIAKIFVVEFTKGYFKALALNVAAFVLLGLIGYVVVKVQEFRETRKK
jgi:hypothetical protein